MNKKPRRRPRLFCLFITALFPISHSAVASAFGLQRAALAPGEACAIGVGVILQRIRGDLPDQRRELEGMAAAACTHQQTGAFGVLADPKVAIKRVAIEAKTLMYLWRCL